MNGETCGENGETCCTSEGKCRAGLWNALPGLVLAITMALAPFFAKKDVQPPEKVATPLNIAQAAAQTAPFASPPLPERAPPELRAKRLGKAEKPEPPAPKSPAEITAKAWSPTQIKRAKTLCESRQLNVRVEYTPLPPIRIGICGSATPLSVKRFKTILGDKERRLSGRDKDKDKRRLTGRDEDKDKRRLTGRNEDKDKRRLTGRNEDKDKRRLSDRDQAKPTGSPSVTASIQSSEPPRQSHETKKAANSAPAVELRPAATMNCRTTDALDRWLRTVVQPRARELLDAHIIRVRNLASYHCRFRNGGGGGKISEHAFANAIDIAEFVTSKGEHIRVADHWNTGDARAQFLREVHKGACGIFTTVLGPDANAAHKNHFHLDMKRRRHKAFCE